MPYITDVYASEVLDSRGNPTVEVEVFYRIRWIWTCTSSKWRFYRRI